MFRITHLHEADEEQWRELFAGYCEFYHFAMPEAAYDRLWREIMSAQRIHARCARREGGEILGIVHFLSHANTWGRDVCYLEDLFTRPDSRGQGVARALIQAVEDWARENDCGRLYWMTHETNATARALYDKLADYRGFIRYQKELG
jgi:GNAT superfamily N-acetyltransferase